MHEEFIPNEIHATPAAIRDTLTQARPAAEQIAAAMRKQAPGRIFLIGNGTSLYSSLAAGYTARALAAPGDSARIAHAGRRLPLLTPRRSPRMILWWVSRPRASFGMCWRCSSACVA